METKGNLVVSTESKSTKTRVYVAGAILCVMGFALAIFFLVNFDSFSKMGREVFGSKPVGVIFGVILVALGFIGAPMYVLINATKANSFCEVYENAVIGTTGLDAKFTNTQDGGTVQKFELKYEDIENVTDNGKIICIYTKYATYKVGAFSNCSEAVREIRARIKK